MVKLNKHTLINSQVKENPSGRMDGFEFHAKFMQKYKTQLHLPRLRKKKTHALLRSNM